MLHAPLDIDNALYPPMPQSITLPSSSISGAFEAEKEAKSAPLTERVGARRYVALCVQRPHDGGHPMPRTSMRCTSKAAYTQAGMPKCIHERASVP